jgi:predicted secreted protein
MMMAGKAFLLKIGDAANPPRYMTVAGLRENEMTIKDGAMTMRATGIFLGSNAEANIRARALDGTAHPYELSFEDGNKLRGEMLVQRLDYAGDFNGERSYSITLSSAGQMVPA